MVTHLGQSFELFNLPYAVAQEHNNSNAVANERVYIIKFKEIKVAAVMSLQKDTNSSKK